MHVLMMTPSLSHQSPAILRTSRIALLTFGTAT
jgi:hypothetical protein